MHLGLRLMYEFENNISISLDGGYMWAKVKDDNGPKVNLDGAYVIPTLGYRF
ncbi:MAG: carbohydrate porin [Deltaproteobacteria bacterium]|nr:carbohydrate porin [Deltaproteobacteria bacterium]